MNAPISLYEAIGFRIREGEGEEFTYALIIGNEVLTEFQTSSGDLRSEGTLLNGRALNEPLVKSKSLDSDEICLELTMLRKKDDVPLLRNDD